jgi:hypothetical protein
MNSRSPAEKRALVIVSVHGAIVASSLATALWLRLGSILGDSESHFLRVGLTIIIPTKVVTFAIGGLIKRQWHDTGLIAIARIFIANTAATLLSMSGIVIWVGSTFPRSVYIIDFVLCLVLCIVARFAFHDRSSTPRPSGLVDRKKTQQPYPAWIPNVLLSSTAFLFVVSCILVVIVYRLATHTPRLEDLSTRDRQELIRLASEVVPPVFQPFPPAGELLFYHMVPNTYYTGVHGDSFTTNDLGFSVLAPAS